MNARPFPAKAFWPLSIGLAGALIVALIALLAPRAAAAGWLVAFFAWSSAPIGALILMLIHGLTGGRWGVAIAPTLRAGVAGTPLLLLFFLPILFNLKAIYPWALAAPDAATTYFNAVGFSTRSYAALIGWSSIAVILLAGRATSLIAALGLAFYGLTVSFSSVDWALSIDPHFADSAFGAEIAVQQIMTALAAAAFVQPARAIEDAHGDLGGLLLAVSLGALYFALMTFIVKWYGDQPDDAAWYLIRVTKSLLALGLGALILGAIGPIAALSWERVRNSALGLRLVGGGVLVGVVMHDFWLVGSVDAWSALATFAALIAMTSLSLLSGPQIDRLIGHRPLGLGVRRDA